MVDDENDTIQRRWKFHMEAFRPSHGIIHPSEPRLHPSVGAAASSIHHTLYHALSHPPPNTQADKHHSTNHRPPASGYYKKKVGLQ